VFTLLAYQNGSVGVNASNTDLTAIDPEWTVFNSHYIFTDQLKLLASFLHGASVTKGRYQAPKFNAFGEFTVFNANRNANVPANPIIDDYRYSPIDLPMNEEMQFQVSGNLGASTERDQAFMFVGTPDWRMQLDEGLFTQVHNFSFTVTPTVGNWSGGQAVTFNQKPLGGVWGIKAMVIQGTNADAFRVIFPRSRLYSGRRPRPGGIIQNAVGDVPMIQAGAFPFGFGMFGYWHTFEPFTVEVFGITASSTTYQGWVWETYYGADPSMLTQKISQNY
jgi:hypothetical protein